MRKEALKYMLYHCRKSNRKVVHFSGCSYLKGKYKRDLKAFHSLIPTLKEGYKLCKCCNPLEKLYRKDEEEVKKFCYENLIAIDFKGHEINFITLDSEWKVIPISRTEYIFLHKNEVSKKKKKDMPKSPIPGYHIQNIRFNNLLPFCEYILRHDNYRDDHPVFIPPPLPPKKGTKRWKKEEKEKRKKEKKKAASNVLKMLDKIAKN